MKHKLPNSKQQRISMNGEGQSGSGQRNKELDPFQGLGTKVTSEAGAREKLRGKSL